MFSLIIHPTNNIHYISSVILSKKYLKSMYHMPGASLDQGDTEMGKLGCLHQEYKNDLKTGLPSRGLLCTWKRVCWCHGKESSESGGGRAVRGGSGHLHLTELVVKSPWSRMRMPLSDPRALRAICVTLGKTFNLSVPPFPNCKMRVMTIMVTTPPVPQEGCCKDSASSHRAFRTVTDMQKAHARVSCSHYDRKGCDGAKS